MRWWAVVVIRDDCVKTRGAESGLRRLFYYLMLNMHDVKESKLGGDTAQGQGACDDVSTGSQGTASLFGLVGLATPGDCGNLFN
jgi:hypothetical protein